MSYEYLQTHTFDIEKNERTYNCNEYLNSPRTEGGVHTSDDVGLEKKTQMN